LPDLRERRVNMPRLAIAIPVHDHWPLVSGLRFEVIVIALSGRVLAALLLFVLPLSAQAANAPTVASHGMVVSQSDMASEVGVEVLRRAAPRWTPRWPPRLRWPSPTLRRATSAAAVFWCIGRRRATPSPTTFARWGPPARIPEMWLVEGEYSFQRHHMSHLSVGVPGTVAGLYLAWQEEGRLPWKRLVEPAVKLAREGIVVSHGLAASIARALPRMERHPASMAVFTRDGEPYEAGDLWVQADLADSLQRIADHGPDGFYKGVTAELIVAEMRRGGGLITLEDLAGYRAVKREPIRGSYRGYGILSMPPPSSGGTTLVQMLNILEGYDIGGSASAPPPPCTAWPRRCAAPTPTGRNSSATPISIPICPSNA
jgi:gamma-glutamyltranspeptidase / glutathione hydrolase